MPASRKEPTPLRRLDLSLETLENTFADLQFQRAGQINIPTTHAVVKAAKRINKSRWANVACEPNLSEVHGLPGAQSAFRYR